MDKIVDGKACPKPIPNPMNRAIIGIASNNQTGLFFHPNGFIIQVSL